MYKRIQGFLKEPLHGNILGISGIDNFYPLIDMNKSEIVDVRFPSVDLQSLPFQDEKFDVVITDQVIEHLENPQKAISESYRVLKTGGIAIHTTCFINYMHPNPLDFWRFSPDALRYLCKTAGFNQVLQCEGWGNRFALILCFISDRLRFMDIPDSGWSVRHLIATKNENNYPISTWIIAKKGQLL